MLQAVDVFETSDLPEVDQHLLSSTDLDSNDHVEILPITPNEAFGRFKGKEIEIISGTSAQQYFFQDLTLTARRWTSVRS